MASGGRRRVSARGDAAAVGEKLRVGGGEGRRAGGDEPTRPTRQRRRRQRHGKLLRISPTSI
uniref:Uncharacterized protein n=1 Tax=Oryza sativa subsp. japonica TaxID=39947 RepID=Q6Z8X7_ORYSJ|nr:hypothetical protein [Oryza sativa Japonica Group]BAD07854.1 hypothetical protein [Oryza sativa Japonica Group]